MGALKDVLGSILADASPEERSKLFRLAFRIIVSVHILWACGWLIPLGMPGFAFAGDIDDKVQAAVEPIRSEIGKVAAKQEQQDEILKQIRADQIAARVRELQRIRCVNAQDGEIVERILGEIEVLQRQYRTLMGERYPVERCAP